MNLTNDQKRKVTIPASMSWYLEIHVECAVKSWNVSRATLKKEGWRSWHLQMHKDPVEKVKPSTAAHCLTNRQATGETRKMASQRIQHPTRGYSPRVSRHLFEPTGVTNLLRTVIANSVVECILRAKTLPLHLTGVGWWSDLPKCRKLPSPKPVWLKKSKNCWDKQIAKTVQENRWIRKLNRLGGSWLGHLPYEEWCRYAGAGRALISHPLGAVFVRCSTPRDPHPPAKLRSLTSLQIVHTHTTGGCSAN